MNVENKYLIHKIQENTIKRRKKARMVTQTFKTVLQEYLISLDSSTKSTQDSIFQ